MNTHLPTLLQANAEYQRTDFRTVPRTPEPRQHLVIVTCMDARLDLFRSLGLQVGDAHILRNAGGRVTDDVIRSLVVSSHLLQTRELLIIHHTNCGLEGTTQHAVAERTGVDEIDFLAFDDIEESLREDLALVEACPHLPEGFWAWGAVYDVDTGELRPLAQ